MNKLKPCPFCGNYILNVNTIPTGWRDNPRVWYVECSNCESRGVRKFTEAEAIAAWNSRAERTCHSVDEIDATQFFVCSNCNFGADDIEIIPNYCPKCGAKVVQDGS